MTIHTLKNKQDKVALSGYDCVILAIGRIPNTDTLGLSGLVSYQCIELTCFKYPKINFLMFHREKMSFFDARAINSGLFVLLMKSYKKPF